ncbi:hypothetical protein [Nonomuraea sp. NPDC002799]
MTRSLFRLAAGAAAGYLFAVRPWHLRWGADDRETHGEMAGDDIVTSPQYQATRALTVDAPAASVWAWLIQLGAYRPGAQRPETPEAGAERQEFKVGDVLPGSPESAGFIVERSDPPHTLVLAQRGADATTSSSISLREIEGGTRLVFRVRCRAQPTVRGTTLIAAMDVGDFLAMRRRLLTIKERAESTH